MNDDIEMYMTTDSGGACYIESLVKAMKLLVGITNTSELKNKLGEVILLELELAKMGAEKAKSEILKATINTVRPIK